MARRSIVSELIEELRRDPRLRDEVASLLGEGVATKADMARVLDRLAEQGQTLERHARAIERLVTAVEEQGRRGEEQGKRLEEQGRRLEEHGRTLDRHAAAIERLVATVEEQGRRLEEQGRRLEEHGRTLERHSAAIERLVAAVEEQGKRLEEQGRTLDRHTTAIERLVTAVEEQGRRIEEQGKRTDGALRRVEALGARWGLNSEAAFREGMRTVLARRLAADVRRWEGSDPEGVVFGRPASVELDVVVRNGGTLLIEIKSHVSRADLGAFHRKASLYEQQHGVRAERLVVSPSVEPRALELAREIGVEVSTSLEE